MAWLTVKFTSEPKRRRNKTTRRRLLAIVRPSQVAAPEAPINMARRDSRLGSRHANTSTAIVHALDVPRRITSKNASAAAMMTTPVVARTAVVMRARHVRAGRGHVVRSFIVADCWHGQYKSMHAPVSLTLLLLEPLE